MNLSFWIMLGVYCVGIARIMHWLNKMIYKIWPDWDDDTYVPNDLSEDYVPDDYR